MRYRTMIWRALLAILTATIALTLMCGGAVFAQPFPSKPVKLVVPYPPGGFPDTVARLLSKALTEKWGQQVIIDNRPGGNGAVAAQTVKSSPSDGYTLLVTTARCSPSIRCSTRSLNTIPSVTSCPSPRSPKRRYFSLRTLAFPPTRSRNLSLTSKPIPAR